MSDTRIPATAAAPHHPHRRRSRRLAVLWCIFFFVTIFSCRVNAVAGHHHSAAEHHDLRLQERRLHQQRQSLEVQRKAPSGPPQESPTDKSSKLWLINSYPSPRAQPDYEWAFKGWHNHLLTSSPTTTTTTTPAPPIRITPSPRQQPPSLWNYARRGPSNSNRTMTRELNPKTG